MSDIDISKLKKDLGAVDLDVIPKEFISTGNIAIDTRICGVGGGYPFGRITEIYGDFSTGKSLLAIHALVEAQSEGHISVFYDAENALEKTFAKNIGLNTDDMVYVNNPKLEEIVEGVLRICKVAKESNTKFVVVVDSLASCITEAEEDAEKAKDLAKPDMGKKAQILSKTMRKINSAVSDSGICLIFINQIREKVGVLFGAKTTTPGGKAVSFYSSVRLELKKKGVITEEVGKSKNRKKVVGVTCGVKVTKNKVAPPFKESVFDMRFDSGIDKFSGLFESLADDGIVEEVHGGFMYKDRKYKKKDVQLFMKENKEVFR